MDKIQMAFQVLDDRMKHPPGSFDSGGRWYPADWWMASCCRSIRNPSRRHPFSLLSHCRTKRHIRTVLKETTGLDADKVHEFVTYLCTVAELKDIHPRERNKPKRACPEKVAYKKVAVINDGELVSIYDGSPYTLGEWRKEPARQGHSGGIYVHETLYDAEQADFPNDSKFKDGCHVIVKCEVGGNYCRYENKLAFSQVKPTEIVAIL